MSIISTLAIGLALSSTSVFAAPQTLTIDASDKTNFVFLDLQEGELKPSSESEPYIFGVRRYIFKTSTGVNGTSVGGTYVGAGTEYESFTSCSNILFEQDETVTMLGYTIDANFLLTSEWFDYDDLGAVVPVDKFFVIARDADCVKLKIKSYAAGLYEIEYQALPFLVESNTRIDESSEAM